MRHFEQGANLSHSNQDRETTGERCIWEVWACVQISDISSTSLPPTHPANSYSHVIQKGCRNIPQVCVVELSHHACNSSAQGMSLAQKRSFTVCSQFFPVLHDGPEMCLVLSWMSLCFCFSVQFNAFWSIITVGFRAVLVAPQFHVVGGPSPLLPCPGREVHTRPLSICSRQRVAFALMCKP